MKNPLILGALFVGAFVVAVFFFKPRPAHRPAPAVEAGPAEQAGTAPAKPATVIPRSRTSNAMPAVTRPAGESLLPQDSRLAALEVSPEDGLTEFVRGTDDRVIAEIDKDPNSLGFEKPRREYTYADGRVVGVTSYRYYPDHVEISRTAVSYNPDGSVDAFEESTTHERTRMKPKGDP